MQVTYDEEIGYLRDSVMPELSKESANFILTLGDNAMIIRCLSKAH